MRRYGLYGSAVFRRQDANRRGVHMKRRTLTGVLAATALLLLVGPLPARAGKCARDAKIDYLECLGQCQEGFQAAKDACLNRDHRCVEACRAEREDCRAATGIDTRLAACDTQLE